MDARLTLPEIERATRYSAFFAQSRVYHCNQCLLKTAALQKSQLERLWRSTRGCRFYGGKICSQTTIRSIFASVIGITLRLLITYLPF